MGTPFEPTDPAGTGTYASPEGSPDAERVANLRAEVEYLRRTMDSHPVIDQARGMVMALGPCSAKEAWEVLVETSQHTNVKLRQVASELVATPEGNALPAPVRQALAEALKRRRSELD